MHKPDTAMHESKETNRYLDGFENIVMYDYENLLNQQPNHLIDKKPIICNNSFTRSNVLSFSTDANAFGPLNFHGLVSIRIKANQQAGGKHITTLRKTLNKSRKHPLIWPSRHQLELCEGQKNPICIACLPV